MLRKIVNAKKFCMFHICLILLSTTLFINGARALVQNTDSRQSVKEEIILNKSGGAGGLASSIKQPSKIQDKLLRDRDKRKAKSEKTTMEPAQKASANSSGGGHGTKARIPDKKTVREKDLPRKSN